MPVDAAQIQGGTMPTPLFPDDQDRAHNASFYDGIRRWRDEEAPGESRVMAAETIEEAYRYGAVTLSLVGLNLTSLPAEINSLSELETLDVSKNRLAALPQSMAGLAKLTSLTLSENHFQILPACLRQLGSLRLLRLDNNLLVELSEPLWTLENLRALSVTNNAIIVLPQDIARLKNLQNLYLSDNHLTALPPEIGHLSALQQLNIERNDLRGLPEEITNLGLLEELYLTANSLPLLPIKLGNLKKLEILDVSKNRLISLPKSISGLECLEVLDVANNKLSILSAQLGRLEKLTALNVSNNNLSRLPEVLHRLTNLDSFNASHNQLTTLPKKISQLMLLEELDVSFNKIYALPDAQRQMPSLLLDGNPILVIEKANTTLIENGFDVPTMLAFLDASYTLAQNEQWALKNSAFINQLTIYAKSFETQRDELSIAIADEARELYKAYAQLPTITKVIAEARKSDLYEDDLHLIFMSADGGEGIIVGRDFYNKNILNLPGMDISWVALAVAKRGEAGNFSIDGVRDIQEDLKPFPLLYNRYILGGTSVNVGKVFDALDFYGDYRQRFEDALQVKSYSAITSADKKLTHHDTHQIALLNIFKSAFTIDPAITTPARDPKNILLSDIHFQRLIENFGMQQASASECAAVLSSLASLFTKYSSAVIFGTEHNSPWVLRSYAVALLNKVRDLIENEPVAQEYRERLTNYQKFLLDNACTSALFENMLADVRELVAQGNRDIAKAFYMIVPPAWR